MKRILTVSIMLFMTALHVMAFDTFCIAKDGKAATIVVDEQDWKGVVRAANDLGDDVRKVTGVASIVKIEELRSLGGLCHRRGRWKSCHCW